MPIKAFWWMLAGAIIGVVSALFASAVGVQALLFGQMSIFEIAAVSAMAAPAILWFVSLIRRRR